LALGLLSALWGRPAPADSAKALAYDFSFEAIEGGRMPLEQWRGKVLLVVNTASFCGFTPQYEGLQALWQRYLARGLVVIGVPSNDFGGQEPKAEAEILGFCKGAYNVSFPLTSKQVVSGGEAHPFYRWAAQSLGAGRPPARRLSHAREPTSARADPGDRGRARQGLSGLLARLQRRAEVLELLLGPLQRGVPALPAFLERRVDHDRGAGLRLWVGGRQAGIGGTGLRRGRCLAEAGADTGGPQQGGARRDRKGTTHV
jgi:glutathione peroxidase